MKQVTRQQDKVHFCFLRQLKDLAKGVDCILPSDRILLGVSDVVVGGQEDTEAAVLSAIRRRVE